MKKILVVDDDPNAPETWNKGFKGEVIVVERGRQALKALKEEGFSGVVLEMCLSDMSGVELLRKIQEIAPTLPVIVGTKDPSVPGCREAMRIGAEWYVAKPYTPKDLEKYFRKRQTIKTKRPRKERIIAVSEGMLQVLEDTERAAKSHANVFITGESGTGKEVVSRLIHGGSPRRGKPFIKVNCAAVSETLMESEYFGHERGAFTGAAERHPGRFELADGGTLLLDEVTEIPLGMQSKLLRVVQEQEFERVGGVDPLSVDVRIVSTSNRDILKALEEKVIRKDLYYRLNVVPLWIPPLRKRREDIRPLAEYFLEVAMETNDIHGKRFADETLEKMELYDWPGNIRQLANVVERGVVLSQNDLLQPNIFGARHPSCILTS